jgi:hypothetical protein
VLPTNFGPRAVTIQKVGMSVVDVDLNHPMAGKDLHFAVEIVDVREASAEEIEHKHVHWRRWSSPLRSTDLRTRQRPGFGPLSFPDGGGRPHDREMTTGTHGGPGYVLYCCAIPGSTHVR